MKNKAPQKVQVWDAGTRMFHWTLVILFALSGYSAFEDKFGIYADIHLWSGYGVLVLVCWRILWGLFGSETARFGHFVKSPRATLAYGKTVFKEASYKWVGHNPMGAWSVVVMLSLLLAQAVMGLFATDGMFFSGPLSDQVDGGLSSSLTEWHEITGYILFGLVGLHLLVILFYALAKKVNLVGPMISGMKLQDGHISKAPQMQSQLLALLILAVVAAVIYWIMFA